jgi:3-hydroxyacyl-CoA dehydrogenase
MQLVEVVRTEALSADIYEILVGVCKRLGKSPVTCKDSPGCDSSPYPLPVMTHHTDYSYDQIYRQSTVRFLSNFRPTI